MMPMMQGFPWPLFAVPVMIGLAMVVFLALRSGLGRGGSAPGCAAGPHQPPVTRIDEGPPREDPMVILRERFARGEIDMPEFEARLEGLLRSDPREAMPWRDK
jgi:hypothetical protein